VECLNVFGTTGNNYIGLTIKYAGEGRPLLMEMVDSGSAHPFHSTFSPQSTGKRDINPILHPPPHKALMLKKEGKPL
jgi:hypothetical protein